MYKKVVVLGGGTGNTYLLRGLKEFPVDLTTVITVSDSGRSTGKLREEFSMPAVGDVRKVISNLSSLPSEIKDVMEYRFNTYSDLDGHSVGNLVLAAMLIKTGNFKQSIEYYSQLMDVKQTILPLSEDNLTLMGETIDGRFIEGEDKVTHSKEKYKRILYKEKPHVLKEVVDSLLDADLIIISMGSLYTSILPHIICEEVQKAIKKSKGKVMYLCNAMTQPGETDGFKVSDHLKVLEQYLGPKSIDVVVASNTIMPEEIIKKYEIEEQKDQVEIDPEEIKKMDIELIEEDLLVTIDGTIRHNSMKLATVVFNYLMR